MWLTGFKAFVKVGDRYLVGCGCFNQGILNQVFYADLLARHLGQVFWSRKGSVSGLELVLFMRSSQSKSPRANAWLSVATR